jgi:hypothetical protein
MESLYKDITSELKLKDYLNDKELTIQDYKLLDSYVCTDKTLTWSLYKLSQRQGTYSLVSNVFLSLYVEGVEKMYKLEKSLHLGKSALECCSWLVTSLLYTIRTDKGVKKVSFTLDKRGLMLCLYQKEQTTMYKITK